MYVEDNKMTNQTRDQVIASQRDFAAPGVLTQYVILALTWGSSFFFVSVGLEGLSPTQVVLARLTIGAAALIPICLLMRQRLPRGAAVWGHLIVVGLLLCVVPFLLFAWAQQHVPSSIASIINATTPLMTMVVAMAALPSERPDRWKIGGLLVGFSGVLLVLAPWQNLESSSAPVGYVACLVATLSYGIAFVYMRRFVSPLGLPAISTATVQVGSAAVIMLLASPWVAAQPVNLTPSVVTSMILLGVFGTGLAYVWNANIVSRWGATPASTVTYVTPIVGIALGVVALGERFGWNQPIGAALVIIGILVSQKRFTFLPGSMRRAEQKVAVRADTYEI
ncbi:MAG: DMT family transporter [Rhodococcus sp. (in: high G+C Gram-positive bacteria)]|uniref:DMT family transporter n=1 Tax=Rhodococcus sp. TaxID=1831 RepID=UPI002AD7D49B|nr:DMT family transporter [Rhodococcus sp. (in: high G+C Gram-positive bacteria)]